MKDPEIGKGGEIRLSGIWLVWDLAEMRAGEVPITQQVGQMASDAGFEAILVSSAADPAGRNLVVFVDNPQPGSALAIVAADRLRGT